MYSILHQCFICPSHSKYQPKKLYPKVNFLQKFLQVRERVIFKNPKLIANKVFVLEYQKIKSQNYQLFESQKEIIDPNKCSQKYITINNIDLENLDVETLVLNYMERPHQEISLLQKLELETWVNKIYQ